MLGFSEFMSGWAALGTGFLGSIALFILLMGVYFIGAGAWMLKTGRSQNPSDPAVTALCGIAIAAMGAGLWLLEEWVGQSYQVLHLMRLGVQATVLGSILVALAYLTMRAEPKLFPGSTLSAALVEIVGSGGVLASLGGIGVLARALVF